MRKEYLIKKEEQTREIAIKIAKSLQGGEIIALEGDLGAGKTTFTQYLAQALGCKENVTSPTFVLMKVYEIRHKALGIRHLVHIDCYRLDQAQELFYLGIEEFLNQKETVVIIEWADKIAKYLKTFKHLIWLKIVIKNKQRLFIIK